MHLVKVGSVITGFNSSIIFLSYGSSYKIYVNITFELKLFYGIAIKHKKKILKAG